MSAIRPTAFTWDGEAMVPLPRFAKLCDEQFVVGETYTMVPHEERSAASHRHYFASVNEAWQNLPEHLTERFPSAERLRKYALIRAGYADERTIVCSSKAEAQRLVGFIQPMDEFAIVRAQGATVTVWTAKSQSERAMGKAEFQKSKDAVLGVLAEFIGSTPRELQHNAARAA